MEMTMKNILLSLIFLAVATNAMADGHHHGGYRGGYWVAPAIIGGIVGYELGRPRYVYEAPPVIIQQPVIVQQPQVVYQQQPVQVCEQKSFQQPNGQIVSGNFCYYK
jgi:hypothetical protein